MSIVCKFILTKVCLLPRIILFLFFHALLTTCSCAQQGIKILWTQKLRALLPLADWVNSGSVKVSLHQSPLPYNSSIFWQGNSAPAAFGCYLVCLHLKGMASYFDSNNCFQVLNKTLLQCHCRSTSGLRCIYCTGSCPLGCILQSSQLLRARCKDAKGRKLVATYMAPVNTGIVRSSYSFLWPEVKANLWQEGDSRFKAFFSEYILMIEIDNTGDWSLLLISEKLHSKKNSSVGFPMIHC